MAARAPDTATSTSSPSAGTVPTLEVRRTIRATRQRVFDAWTKPEERKKWSAPGPMIAPLVEIDLRVGGGFRLHMRSPDGTEHRVAGVYREIDPPNKLVYTWLWESEPSMENTLVTVEFIDLGDRTEVVLRHTGFPTITRRDNHETGWIGCMTKLEALF
jgi:uncharacterized protein YndB with AHSA1/START domain